MFINTAALYFQLEGGGFCLGGNPAAGGGFLGCCTINFIRYFLPQEYSTIQYTKLIFIASYITGGVNHKPGFDNNIITKTAADIELLAFLSPFEERRAGR